MIVRAARLCALLIVVGPGLSLADGELERIRGDRDDARAAFARDLEEVATFCESKGLAEAARSVRANLVEDEPDDGRIVVRPLPRTMQPELSRTLPADEYTWRSRVLKAREEYAAKLYVFARRALKDGHPSYAHALIREIAEIDPDHRAARRLLGWVPHDGEWVTPFARSMTAKRYVWHERFGWLPRTYVEKYENGERRVDGRWVPVAQEEAYRRDFRNAWEVRTAHYLVRTNHSLEEGVRIARALELYHDFFKSVFASFFVSPEQQQALFDGGTSRRSREKPKPYVVHFYRDKADYVAALEPRFPQISITNGLYQSGDRIAYFFHDPKEENLPTIFHEATHQLFYESTSAAREVGGNAHFWIVEGIACYMESFDRVEGGLTCGDPRFIRFDNARYRLLTSGDYEPFARFSSHGMRAFQNVEIETLQKRYSQASGMAHFLMHYDNGRYRDALITHLAELYAPRNPLRVRTIPEILGVRSTVLDQQYRAFLENQQEQLARQQRDGE